MYSEAGAARLLQLAPTTLHYWLEGGRQGGKPHKPVIREQPAGSGAPVTWAEFVEASFLRQYRKLHAIPMAELRKFIDQLREEYGVPYPLAHAHPFVGGRKLVMEIQTNAGLAPDFAVINQVGGQYVLSTAAQEFYERVTWDHDLPARWRPTADADSPVIIDPEVRFGQPSVGGISTKILWEQSQAGEDETELAETYGLDRKQVRWAVSYQMALEAA